MRLPFRLRPAATTAAATAVAALSALAAAPAPGRARRRRPRRRGRRAHVPGRGRGRLHRQGGQPPAGRAGPAPAHRRAPEGGRAPALRPASPGGPPDHRRRAPGLAAHDLAAGLRGPCAPRAGPAVGSRAARALDAHRRPAPRRRGPVAAPDAVDAQPARARDRQPGGPRAPPAARGEQHAAGRRPEGSHGAGAGAGPDAAAPAPGRRGARRRGRRHPSAVGLGEERGDRRRGGEGGPHPRAGRLPVPAGTMADFNAYFDRDWGRSSPRSTRSSRRRTTRTGAPPTR